MRSQTSSDDTSAASFASGKPLSLRSRGYSDLDKLLQLQQMLARLRITASHMTSIAGTEYCTKQRWSARLLGFKLDPDYALFARTKAQVMTKKDIQYASDVAFTPSVKDIQVRKGSRRGYERMETGGSWQTDITDDLAAFIESRTTVYLATVNQDGQPYVQHRGGPPGFLKVLTNTTIGFADFSGNRQYITQGNLVDSPKAFLFLMDYTYRQRVKIWGEAKVIENDADLEARLKPADYNARVEQAIVFTVTAWDANCPQHIPRMIDESVVKQLLAEKEQKISELEEKIALLEAHTGPSQ